MLLHLYHLPVDLFYLALLVDKNEKNTILPM